MGFLLMAGEHTFHFLPYKKKYGTKIASSENIEMFFSLVTPRHAPSIHNSLSVAV